MIPLMVRELAIGEGIPKICIPLTGETEDELKKETEDASVYLSDMVEWRFDNFAAAFAPNGTIPDINAACNSLVHAGAMLRKELADMPILFTVRTAAEGGRAEIFLPEYERLITVAASSGFADMVDVELFTEGENFQDILDILNGYGVKVVGSSHDFLKTPSKEELFSRLERMREAGADVCKIAVMPSDTEDVVTLLLTSLAMKKTHPDTPLIALSMGEQGAASRVAGEIFGSDITFAAGIKASAPGQISAVACRYIMDIIHSEL